LTKQLTQPFSKRRSQLGTKAFLSFSRFGFQRMLEKIVLQGIGLLILNGERSSYVLSVNFGSIS